MGHQVEDQQQPANAVQTAMCSKTQSYDDHYYEVQELLHLVRSDEQKTHIHKLVNAADFESAIEATSK